MEKIKEMYDFMKDLFIKLFDKLKEICSKVMNKINLSELTKKNIHMARYSKKKRIRKKYAKKIIKTK